MEEVSSANSTEELYIVDFNEDRIVTTVTSKASVVDHWISEIRRIGVTIVGLDTEWCLPRTIDSRRRSGPVAILQLCVGCRCLIFQLVHADYIPQSLKDFLTDPAIEFVGVGVEGDARKLLKDFGLSVGCKKDLRPLAAAKLEDGGLTELGLQSLASLILGARMNKRRVITMSEWDSKVLMPTQVDYACIDAFVSFMIGKCLMPEINCCSDGVL